MSEKGKLEMFLLWPHTWVMLVWGWGVELLDEEIGELDGEVKIL